MRGPALYIASYVAGLAAFILGRSALAMRDVHRNALRRERAETMTELLSPYERVRLRSTTMRRG